MNEFEDRLSKLKSLYNQKKGPSFEEVVRVCDDTSEQIKSKLTRLIEFSNTQIIPVINTTNSMLLEGKGLLATSVTGFAGDERTIPEKMHLFEDMLHSFYPTPYIEDSYLVGNPEGLLPVLENLVLSQKLEWDKKSNSIRRLKIYINEKDIRDSRSIFEVSILGEGDGSNDTYHIDGNDIQSIHEAIIKIISNPEDTYKSFGRGGTTPEVDYR